MEQILQYIFSFAYGAGLNDATAQKAYPGESKKFLRENNEAKDIVRAYIDGILNGENPDFYAVAKRLQASFNKWEEQKGYDEPLFSFGNAQKLINITVKFMYLAAYSNYAPMRSRFQNCHCPLDRQMGARVKREICKIVKRKIRKIPEAELPDSILEIIKRDSWKGFDGTWSKIEEKVYEDYQAVVQFLAAKENLIPLEYDFRYFDQPIPGK